LKKRLSFIFIYLCLLALLCLGAGELLFVGKGERMSESENRMLRAFPSFSAGTLADGSFMDGFEAYLSDAFFFRDGAAAFHDGVMGLVAVPDDGPETGVVEDERLWEQSEEQEAAFQQLIESEQPAGTADDADAAKPAGETAEARDVHVWLERQDGTQEILFGREVDEG